MKKILVTGANGFVGREVLRMLLSSGHSVRACVRSKASKQQLQEAFTNNKHLDTVITGNIGPETNWEKALEDINCVVHLAARVHILNETAPDPLAEFRKVNVEGTRKIAEYSAKMGVSRFVYLSSISVNGKQNFGKTADSQKLTENDPPNPQTPYGISKFESENLLNDLCQKSNMKVVILRPPLVYGPEVGANFLRLLKLVKSGIPLPLASVRNKRSYLYVKNLADVILHIVNKSDISSDTYLIDDNFSISTGDVIRSIGKQINKPARLLPFPTKLLILLAKVTGKSALIDRLLSASIIDSRKISEKLEWSPPYTFQEGIEATTKWFSSSINGTD